MITARNISIFLSLGLLFELVTSQDSCQESVSKVLAINSPEFMLIPDEAEFNTFTTSELQISFNWEHIHTNLNQSCVEAYLVEYGSHKYDRHKRETVSNSAQVSPPISGGKFRYLARVKDTCDVLSVHLIALVQGRMITSRSRRFWPAAHRTSIEAYSDSLLLKWPPNCTPITQNWRLEVFLKGDHEARQEVQLFGESQIHLPSLSQCQRYELLLYSHTSKEDKGVQADLLWTFEDINTLPKPDFHIKSYRRELDVIIDQSTCDKNARVDHWRITRCIHAKTDIEASPQDEVGSGGNDFQYYFYDNEVLPQRGRMCVSIYQDFSKEAGSMWKNSIKLVNLDECTLYSIDLISTNPNGKTLQPAEQYGTIHSTLCREGDDGSSEGFWFEEGDDLVHSKLSNLGNTTVYISLGLVGLFLLICLIAVTSFWLLFPGKFARSVKKSSKKLKSHREEEQESLTPKIALLSKH